MNYDTLVTDLAAALDVDPATLQPETDLREVGMNSLLLMTLVEDWRAEGIDVDYYDMFALATLGEWAAHLA